MSFVKRTKIILRHVQRTCFHCGICNYFQNQQMLKQSVGSCSFKFRKKGKIPSITATSMLEIGLLVCWDMRLSPAEPTTLVRASQFHTKDNLCSPSGSLAQSRQAYQMQCVKRLCNTHKQNSNTMITPQKRLHTGLCKNRMLIYTPNKTKNDMNHK